MVFVSWQDAVLLQFDVGGAVHVYEVGLPEQFAFSVIVWPTVGFDVLAVGVQTGVWTVGGGGGGGGGLPPLLPCHLTSTVDAM